MESAGTISPVIRIMSPINTEAFDWRVDRQISFTDVMDAFGKVIQPADGIVDNSFDYKDEEGDLITVKSDEELQTMIAWHIWNTQKIGNGFSAVPLEIYPKIIIPSVKRNLLGLTVDLEAAPASTSKQGSGDGSSGRKQARDLQTILGSGQICQMDLQYLAHIGHGNGGTVNKAIHNPSHRLMAVKVIPLDLTVEIQRQILSELDILFKCNSVFILGFFGAFFTENKISICTEFMDGGSLDTYGCIPQNVLSRIAVAVVKGLQYLWDWKILHRDVKPSNILVNTRGQVKLCDFGVSIQLVNSIAKTYIGTNTYMAPERVMGDQYGIHSDVWSLGLSLVEMSTGVFPYPSDPSIKRGSLSPIELLQCIVNEPPPCLHSQQYGDALRDFVGKCLQKQPQDRPTPEQLSHHPLVVENDTDIQQGIIAHFLTTQSNHPT